MPLSRFFAKEAVFFFAMPDAALFSLMPLIFDFIFRRVDIYALRAAMRDDDADEMPVTLRATRLPCRYAPAAMATIRHVTPEAAPSFFRAAATYRRDDIRDGVTLWLTPCRYTPLFLLALAAPRCHTYTIFRCRCRVSMFCEGALCHAGATVICC